jgi:hypothetical protein
MFVLAGAVAFRSGDEQHGFHGIRGLGGCDGQQDGGQAVGDRAQARIHEVKALEAQLSK